MLRTIVRLTPTFAISIIGNRNENDYDICNRPTDISPKTGIERVKNMFKKNEFDEVSVELHTVVQGGLTGIIVGVCFGGFIKSRDAYLYFIENNQATIFKSTNEAKKLLQTHVTLGFFRGAYHWGWRLGIFSLSFSLISTIISVYQDESSLVDYVIAGAITGGLYKANLGLAASIVGAGLGATLSLLGGSLILGILKATGVSMEDIRHALYKIKLAREDQLNQAKEKAAEIKHDDVTRHHDMMIERKGEKKIEEL